MVSNTPEYLVDEILKQYGISVPLEKAIIYLECDPYLTPETLFRYVISEEDIIVGNDDEAPCDDEQR